MGTIGAGGRRFRHACSMRWRPLLGLTGVLVALAGSVRSPPRPPRRRAHRSGVTAWRHPGTARGRHPSTSAGAGPRRRQAVRRRLSVACGFRARGPTLPPGTRRSTLAEPRLAPLGRTACFSAAARAPGVWRGVPRLAPRGRGRPLSRQRGGNFGARFSGLWPRLAPERAWRGRLLPEGYAQWPRSRVQVDLPLVVDLLCAPEPSTLRRSQHAAHPGQEASSGRWCTTTTTCTCRSSKGPSPCQTVRLRLVPSEKPRVAWRPTASCSWPRLSSGPPSTSTRSIRVFMSEIPARAPSRSRQPPVSVTVRATSPSTPHDDDSSPKL